MRPHLRARIAGSTACVHRNADFRLTSDGAVEIVFGEIIDAAHDGDAGIVDENVDRTERGRDLFDHRRHGRRLRDVGRDRDGATAVRLDAGDDGFGIGCALAIIDGDRGARPRQAPRAIAAPMPRDAARHQRDMRSYPLSPPSILRRVYDGVAPPRQSAGVNRLVIVLLEPGDQFGRRTATLPSAGRSPRFPSQAFGLALLSPEHRCRSSSSRDRRSADRPIHAGVNDRRLQIAAVHPGEQVGIDDVFRRSRT